MTGVVNPCLLVTVLAGADVVTLLVMPGIASLLGTLVFHLGGARHDPRVGARSRAGGSAARLATTSAFPGWGGSVRGPPNGGYGA